MAFDIKYNDICAIYKSIRKVSHDKFSTKKLKFYKKSYKDKKYI